MGRGKSGMLKVRCFRIFWFNFLNHIFFWLILLSVIWCALCSRNLFSFLCLTDHVHLLLRLILSLQAGTSQSLETIIKRLQTACGLYMYWFMDTKLRRNLATAVSFGVRPKERTRKVVSPPARHFWGGVISRTLQAQSQEGNGALTSRPCYVQEANQC